MSIATAIAALLLVPPADSPPEPARWGCYDPEPGHPKEAERRAFVAAVGPLAIAAERRHGVPAPAIAAMAIAESGFGFTRTALSANNLFGFKMPRRGAEGRDGFRLDCQPAYDPGSVYVRFRGRADAMDYVANRLETQATYAAATRAFRSAPSGRRNDAIATWLAAVAARYNVDPSGYRARIMRIMNSPFRPGPKVDPATTLFSLQP